MLTTIGSGSVSGYAVIHHLVLVNARRQGRIYRPLSNALAHNTVIGAAAALEPDGLAWRNFDRPSIHRSEYVIDGGTVPTV